MESGWAGEWREIRCRVRNKWKRTEFVGESGLSGREVGHLTRMIALGIGRGDTIEIVLLKPSFIERGIFIEDDTLK